MELTDANSQDTSPIVEDVVVEGTENIDTVLTDPIDVLETVTGTTEPDPNGVVVDDTPSYNVPLIITVAVIVAGIVIYLRGRKK